MFQSRQLPAAMPWTYIMFHFTCIHPVKHFCKCFANVLFYICNHGLTQKYECAHGEAYVTPRFISETNNVNIWDLKTMESATIADQIEREQQEKIFCPPPSVPFPLTQFCRFPIEATHQQRLFCAFLDLEGGSEKATLVVLLIGIISLKVQKCLRLC